MDSDTEFIRTMTLEPQSSRKLQTRSSRSLEKRDSSKSQSNLKRSPSVTHTLSRENSTPTLISTAESSTKPWASQLTCFPFSSWSPEWQAGSPTGTSSWMIQKTKSSDLASITSDTLQETTCRLSRERRLPSTSNAVKPLSINAIWCPPLKSDYKRTTFELNLSFTEAIAVYYSHGLVFTYKDTSFLVEHAIFICLNMIL